MMHKGEIAVEERQADLILGRGKDSGDADRKAKLVKVAAELLGDLGMEGLTIRSVLERSGLARRAFYECFESKDDLVLAVFDQALHDATFHFRRAASVHGYGPLENIQQVVEGIVKGRGLWEAGVSADISERRVAALSREHLRLAQLHPAELERALASLLEFIVENIIEGMAQGVVRVCDPAIVAALIYNVVSTTVHTQVQSGGSFSNDQDARDHLAREIWLFCWHAISA